MCSTATTAPPAALEATQDEPEAVLGLGIYFHGGQQPARVDRKQYAALYLASDEWPGQVDGLTQDGRLFVAAPARTACRLQLCLLDLYIGDAEIR